MAQSLLDDSALDDELDSSERRERVGPFFFGSLGLHAGVIGALVLSLWLHNRLHGNNWGQDMTQGAISASLVSSAPTIPLPSTQPPTKNVLATETPSPAPAIPEKKLEAAPDLKAIPLAAKTPDKPKPPPPKPTPPQQEQKHPQDPPKQNRANFGEQAPANMPRSMASNQNATNSPVAVGEGDFGSRFGWYVNVINRKVRENWYIQEVDPSTQQGRQAVVSFTIARDGSPSNFQIARSSGVQSLDTSAIRAAQRVDSFGPLPPGYNGSSVSVAYTFTYEQPGH